MEKTPDILKWNAAIHKRKKAKQKKKAHRKAVRKARI